jgi:hypothetical protein
LIRNWKKYSFRFAIRKLRELRCVVYGCHWQHFLRVTHNLHDRNTVNAFKVCTSTWRVHMRPVSFSQAYIRFQLTFLQQLQNNEINAVIVVVNEPSNSAESLFRYTFRLRISTLANDNYSKLRKIYFTSSIHATESTTGAQFNQLPKFLKRLFRY